MTPVPFEDFDHDESPRRSLWRALGDLAVSALLVCAIALVVSFITATSQ